MSILLPLGIEKYLHESGFSPSEIIVLKKLLEENLLTIRELAAKTGKGNSVIDAALKKLIRRDIVGKENINGSPKYKVIDPQEIVAWMKRNLKQHTEMMERKHQSFEQFMNTLSVAKNHPEMEHFSGKSGLMKAYDKLLEGRTELLTYFDPASIADDPLSEFRAQYFRRRQVHDIFQRVIAPDSILARRFRSRDPFEYRKTILVQPKDYPLSFEKIIAGDIVACIDINRLEASFIHFPKFAESERIFFEQLWSKQIAYDREGAKQSPITVIPRQNTLPSFNIYQKICSAFLLLLCTFWTALFVTNTTEGFFNYLYSFLFGLIPLVSGFIAIRSIGRWGGIKTALGKAVLLMGLGVFLWGCGEMVWSYYNFVLGTSTPYPSIADLGFAPSIFFYSLGVIYLSNATGAKLSLRSMYAKVFTVIAPLIILSLSYYAFIVIARGGTLLPAGETTLKMILDIVYPLGDFLGLTIAVLISSLSFKYMGGKYAVDIGALLLGLAVMFVGDFIFSYTTTVGTYYNGNAGDLVLTMGVFLLSFGLLGFTQDKAA